MTDLFAQAWARTGSIEAGYVNNPNDSGGETNYGVTIAVARAHGYTGPMKDMPQSTAVSIAKELYWDSLMLDNVGALSPAVADELFDIGYLSGTSMAGVFFQRALNLFSRTDLPLDKRPYPPLIEDGRVGKMTIYAFQKFIDERKAPGEQVMLRALAVQQGTHFIDITRASEKDGEFVFGWFSKRVSV